MADIKPILEENEEQDEIITLTLDDGEEVKCNILGIFEVEEKEYIALLPLEEDEVLIYSYKENGEEISLENIETDEEFDMVSEVFYSMFDEEDFDNGEEEYEYEEYDEEE
ncbi:MAG: DUF1292 domain-containing protein [Defluviitaleaceae bacterium]|nr:DUF1292 domain-containing protein [Defluviitaleaceae bacterium]